MSPQTTFDCKTEFLAKEGGARLIAEDILTYCQIYILENSAVSHEYCDFIRKNVIDGLFENDQGDKVYASVESESNTKSLNLKINDDILLGTINLASTQVKLPKNDHKVEKDEDDVSFDHHQDEDEDDEEYQD